MSNKIANENEDNIALIHKHNVPSLKSALKVGSSIANSDYQIVVRLEQLTN